ncbi:MAG: heavy-metal-associated domain-containing protein [Gammaproteobacteria bacterium]
MKVLAFSLFALLSITGVRAEDITVKVNGMVCSLCAQGIQKKFKAIRSVQEIKVDLSSKLVSIKTQNANDLADDKIKTIITEAGYNVASIERK